MTSIKEIYSLIEEYSVDEISNPDIDIFKDLNIYGDDFHHLIDAYSKKYNIDMSQYLWCFHGNEEGFGGVFGFIFPPPYKRVKRIPVTPKLLKEFADKKKWDMEYPTHYLPKRRWDLITSSTILLLVLITMIIYYMV